MEPSPVAVEATAVAGAEKSGMVMEVDIATMAVAAAAPSLFVSNKSPPPARRSRSIRGGGLRSKWISPGSTNLP